MKKTLLAVAFSLAFVGAASAQGIAGGIVVGGVAGGFAGSASGTAFSNSQGSAVAASQVNGYGSSYQHSDGVTGGTATIGGAVNHVGATITTGTTQYATTNSWGGVTGNAPIMAGDSIANGTAGFGSTKVGAAGNSQFATGAIGGVIAIGGVAGITGF